MSKRLPAEERRDSIIEVSKRLFAEKGFHGVSIDEIVKQVGVSPSILYRHFASKEKLYEAVLQEFSATRESYVDTVVDDDTRFETVLRGMTRVFVDSIVSQPELLKMEMHSQLEGNSASQDFFINRWKSFTDYIEYNLTESQNQGLLKPFNVKAAALIYQGMIRELLLLKCLHNTDRLTSEPIDELIDEMISLYMHMLH